MQESIAKVLLAFVCLATDRTKSPWFLYLAALTAPNRQQPRKQPPTQDYSRRLTGPDRLAERHEIQAHERSAWLLSSRS